MNLPIISTSVYTSGQGASFMAYVPGCRYDVFISYAHYDNEEGWVIQFEKALNLELRQLIGKQFSEDSIFFDKRELGTAQIIIDALAIAAQESAILLPILSPSYFTSPYCNQERTDFFRKLPYRAESVDCLAPILIRRIDEEQMPKLYQGVKWFSFLDKDERTPLSAGSFQWISKLKEFADQLKNALQRLRHNCEPIFLGKAADPQSQESRAWCKTEIEKGLGFRTVPDYFDALDNPDATRRSLEAAGLAVHFLGGSDSASREAIQTSMKGCKGPTFLFQPLETKLTPDERFWLYEFECDLQPTLSKYQRLEGKTNQELLALINEQMTVVRVKSERTIARTNLTIICEGADLGGVRQMQDEIKTKHQIEIQFPNFLGPGLMAMERLHKWHDYLSSSNAFLFYYGASKRELLEFIWSIAENRWPNIPRSWFLAPPDLNEKRKQYPNALSEIDQVIRFLDPERNTQ